MVFFLFVSNKKRSERPHFSFLYFGEYIIMIKNLRPFHHTFSIPQTFTYIPLCFDNTLEIYHLFFLILYSTASYKRDYRTRSRYDYLLYIPLCFNNTCQLLFFLTYILLHFDIIFLLSKHCLRMCLLHFAAI